MKKGMKRPGSILLSLAVLLAALVISGGQSRAASPYFSGEGTEASPFLIAEEEDLAELASLVNQGDKAHSSAHYRLEKDLDLSAWANWTPIGLARDLPFAGNFHGNQKTIHYLSINTESEEPGLAYGLFGHVTGHIEHLNVMHAAVQVTAPDAYVAAIAGHVLGGTMSGVMATGQVNLTASNDDVHSAVAGIAGGLMGTVTLASNGTNIAFMGARGHIGGVAGSIHDGATVENSRNFGLIVNHGPVNEDNTAGGIIGHSLESAAVNTVNYGRVSGPNGGGIMGMMEMSRVERSGNEGEVESAQAGGIAGLAIGSMIHDSYNSEEIAGGSVGGLAGTGDSLAIERSYNTGGLNSAEGIVGSLVGTARTSLTVTDSYFLDIVTEPVGLMAEGTTANMDAGALTADQLKDMASLAGFDFNARWIVLPEFNNGYPIHRETERLQFTSLPSKLVYAPGESFDAAGGQLIHLLESESGTTALTADMIRGFDSRRSGTRLAAAEHAGIFAFMSVEIPGTEEPTETSETTETTAASETTAPAETTPTTDANPTDVPATGSSSVPWSSALIVILLGVVLLGAALTVKRLTAR